MTLKPHDLSSNPKSKCQKLFIFTLQQIQLEGDGFKDTMKKLFKGTKKIWKTSMKRDLKKSLQLFQLLLLQNKKKLKQLKKRVIVVDVGSYQVGG